MIVSLFGVINTLVLSVFERTRELGMLRAIGMTRRQVRRMIRHESIVTALIGAALGIAVGIFLAVLTTIALSDYGIVFAVPTGTLVVFVGIAILAGMLAAILPARRASRLNCSRRCSTNACLLSGLAVRGPAGRTIARSGARPDAKRRQTAAVQEKRRRADGRTRTGDPFITSEVLYQLSYVGRGLEA